MATVPLNRLGNEERLVVATRKSERRAPDPRLDQLVQDQSHLHDCVEDLKSKVVGLKLDIEKNTQVTEQVRDILGTFKVTMAVGKWIGAAGAAAAGITAAIKGWKT